MKKIMLTSFCALAVIQSGWAQSSSASNTLTGTTTAPNEYLGSSNNFDVLFKSNGAERARFTAAGALGVGITTPARTLHVQTSSTNGGMRVTQTGTGFSSMELFNSTTGGHNWSMVSTGNGNGEGAGHFGIYDYTSPAGYRMFIQGSTGNVGIGTGSAAPGGRLAISDNGTNKLTIYGNSWGDIQASGSFSPHFATGNFYSVYEGTVGSGTLRMEINPGGTVTMCTNGGYLGVGTLTPAHMVDVTGDVNIRSTDAYRINGNRFLWHNGDTKDIMLGHLAGNATMTGHYNTFLGNNAGNANTSGAGNTFTGRDAGRYNTTGSQNTFFGTNAGGSTSEGVSNTYVGGGAGNMNGYGTTGGSYNTVVGAYSGLDLIGGETFQYENSCFFGYNAGLKIREGNNNVFMGYLSGTNTFSGSNNVFVGYNSGTNNTGGAENVALGYEALKTQSYGGAFTNINFYNVAVGNQSLYTTDPTTTTNGIKNTALGYRAGYTNTTGYNNTFVGYAADANAGTYNNASAFGNSTVVNATNKVRIGNGNVTVIEGQVAFSSTSDARFKFNVQEDVKGLEFINRLRPVSYQFDTEKFDDFLNKNVPDSIRAIRKAGMDYEATRKIIHTGFIAQEIEQAAKESKFTTDIVHVPADANDNYSVSYASIVVPLVKAVQEQQEMIKEQGKLVEEMKKEIEALKENKTPGQATGTMNVDNIELSDVEAIVLDQNVPNPFAEQTTIHYTIPEGTSRAQMLFYNAGGQLIKAMDIAGRGEGQLNVFANDLSNGVYTYVLVVDGKISGSKKMQKQK